MIGRQNRRPGLSYSSSTLSSIASLTLPSDLASRRTASGLSTPAFNITNATCAEYYLYVSVTGDYNPPPPAPPAAEDAGTGD